MKDIYGKIQYKEKEYTLVFNLNVMEAIQEEYGTVQKWVDLVSGEDEKEINAKAARFGFTQMLNEGIEIDNEDNGTDTKPLTLRQVGRMISEIGLMEATISMNDTVIKSTQTDIKN